jgi:hypothetical protein
VPLVADLGPDNITPTRPGAYVASGRLGSFKATNKNWYAVYFERDVGTLLPQIRVYKSTDNGATFNTLVASGPDFTLYVSVARAGDVLYVAYQNAGDTGILTITFDMIAEAFGGVNDPGIASNSSLMPDQALSVAANLSGEIFIVWTLQDALTTTAECFGTVFSGGVWGPQVHINAGVPRGVAENCLAAGANFSVLWSNWVADGNVGSSFGTRVSLFYSVFTAGVLASTVTAMLDASKVNNTELSWPVLYPGVYDSAADRVVFPIGQDFFPHTPGEIFEMDVLVGVPSAAPVFTLRPVFVVAPGITIVSSPRLAGPGAPFTMVYAGFPLTRGFFAGTLKPPPGLFVLVWAQDDGSGTTTYQNCVAADPAGVWSAPGLFLDTGVATTDTDPQFFMFVNSEPQLGCWPFSTDISPAGAFPQRAGERV